MRHRLRAPPDCPCLNNAVGLQTQQRASKRDVRKAMAVPLVARSIARPI